MPEPAAVPRVCVVLVNWNGLEDTLECLASLAKVTYPRLSVVVVDNGSRGDEAGALGREYPEAVVVAAGANLGFTGGNNLGIEHALASGADYVLCLNNDTVVDPGFLEPLVAALEGQPQRGIAGSYIFYQDRPDELWYSGASVSFDVASARQGRIAWHELPPAGRLRAREPFETEVVTGCALLARADLMRRLGGFDDRYFAYLEDVDLSLRARRLGFTSVVAPASRVWHKVSAASGGEMSAGVRYYLVRNTRLLARTHAPAGTGEAVYRAYLGAVLRDALGRPCASGSERRRRVQAALIAAWSAYAGRYGRRQDRPLAERILGACLVPAVPALFFALRVQWLLQARLARRLHSRELRPAGPQGSG